MLPNAFIGKTKAPTDAEVADALGPARELWDLLLAELAGESGLVDREWNSSSPKTGWALRLKHQKRNIVYLSPCKGGFRAAFALGDKAVRAARQSGLPRQVIEIIDQAKRYAEGTAVRIEVKGPTDIAVVRKLTSIKLEH